MAPVAVPITRAAAPMAPVAAPTVRAAVPTASVLSLAPAVPAATLTAPADVIFRTVWFSVSAT